MGRFRDAQPAIEARWVPAKIITVPPEAFATEWAGRPLEDVEIGLRSAPDFDTEKASSVAAARAAQMHDVTGGAGQAAIDCYNDELLRYIIARSTCRPDDSRRPYFEMAEDTVRHALSTAGVRLLAHEIEVFQAETDPTVDPATDDELQDLAAMLQNGPPWVLMDEADQRGTRRLASVLLDRFGAALMRKQG